MPTGRHVSGLNLSKSFSESLDKAVEIFRSTPGFIRIVSHYDPDGMTAAALLTRAMMREGRQFHVSLTSKLDPDFFDSLADEKPDILIMADMGAGNIGAFAAFGCPVIVLDHHFSEDEGADNVTHVNPHLFGLNGAKEACGATLSLAFATTLESDNWDLASLAVAGAVGDRQNLGGFRGLNEDICQVAKDKNILKPEMLLDLRGQTIYESLMHYPEPYFAGLTGNKRAIKKFLKAFGLDEESKLKDLETAALKRITSELAIRLLKQGAAPEAIDQLVSNRFWLYGQGMYADELVAILNACSRQGKLGVGLSAALGSASDIEAAMDIRDRHKAWILETMQKVEKNGPKTLKHIQYFHVGESTYTGVIGGLAALYIFDRTKPTFGLYTGEEQTHISARAPKALVARGLDLGAACSEISSQVGGTGGGHNIASGAKVPSKNEKAFLKLMDRAVGKQLS